MLWQFEKKSVTLENLLTNNYCYGRAEERKADTASRA